MPPAKGRQRGIRDREARGDQLFVDADQVAPALLEQLDDLIAVRVCFFGPIKLRHRRGARHEDPPDRPTGDLQGAGDLADPVALRL
jgi:hypothetical protein